ncbi:Dockerin type I repeat-containing protein [Ruminococcaceae bacterium P7]|nr:Dockerin type I repeat-containing protein [Ruminococcaceae bacterium P7]
MKQFKRFISVLLSALMTAAVLTALPFAASAASDIYVITGDSVWLDGWNPQSTENVMTRKADDTYAITVRNVLSYDENYQLQVVRFIGGDKNRKEWYGANGTTYNYDFRVTADCDVTVAFDPSTKTIAASGKGVAEAEYPIEKLVAVGSGKDGFLNNVSWGLNAEANEMKETAKGVYRLVCDSVRANRSYQVKFAANGSWMMNWGYDGAAEVRLNEANPALYNSPTNITFTPVSQKDYVRLTLTLDLSGWDKLTKSGATWRIDVADAAAPTTQPPTTKPQPTTVIPTTKPQPTTVKPTQPATQKPTVKPTQPATEPTEAPIVTTQADPQILTVNATSNIAPQVSETFSNGEKQITVTWWIQITADNMVNAQFSLSYDKSKLEVDMTPGVNAVFDAETGEQDENFLILRFADRKGTVANLAPQSMPNGGIKGNVSDVSGFKMNRNGYKVPFVSVTFKPKAGASGETTVNLKLEHMQLGSRERVPYYLFKDGRLVRGGISYRPTDRAAAVYAGTFKDDEPQPTTEAPTTVAPTTKKPQPTTIAPTTKPQPTTIAPTTKPQPTTIAPTTKPQPTTAVPTTKPQPTTAVPTTVHVHTEVIDPEKPATFEETGLTEGSHCSVCGEIIRQQEVIPVLHNEKKTQNGVTVVARNDAELFVRKVDDASVLSRIRLDDKVKIYDVYEIRLMKNGKAVQPLREVTVTIPCEDDKMTIYRLADNNALLNTHAAFKDDSFTFTTSELGCFVLAAPELKLGDVNRNGSVDVGDATLVQKSAAEIYTLSKTQRYSADVNGDGKIDIMDATLIQQYVAETIIRFPAEKT